VDDIERVVFRDDQIAGPAEMSPIIDKLHVLVEDLDTIVRAIGDEQATLRVERQPMRPDELTGTRSQLSELADEFPISGKSDETISVLLRGRRTRPMAIGDNEIP